MALLGSHQRENAQTAVAALDSLGVVPEAITRGLRETRWPGRLQRTAGEPEILLDAAHNPAGAEALARFLTEHEAGRRIHLVFAASRDKALEEVAGNLFPLCHTVTITQFGVARSVRTETLAKIVDHLHSQISPAPGVSEALARARQAAEPQDLIVVAGSIFLVGEAMTALGIEP